MPGAVGAPVRFAACVALALLLLPPVLAHHDPTHGVAPHGVAASGVVPVDIGTPHPYPYGRVYEWSVRVEDAQTLSVHFERYDVNGWFSPWLGRCTGSVLTIMDGRDGAVLEELCGEQPARDFWTRDFATDTLVLRFATEGIYGDHYGFDVHEVGVDGARPLVAIPYGPTLTVDADPEAGLSLDPWNLPQTGVTLGVEAEARHGDIAADGVAHASLGRFRQCGFLGCTTSQGVGLDGGVDVMTPDGWAAADAYAYALRNSEDPLDWWIPLPMVGCGVVHGALPMPVFCPYLG